MIKEFDFGVLTYNGAAYVLSTLESIRYQVEHYGDGIKCRLIVIDDCSTDNSVEIVHHWLAQRADVFAATDILINEVNQGTSFSFNRLLEHITARDFKIIAADDLISCNNIFDSYEHLENDDIHSYFAMDFSDHQCYFSDAYAAFFLYKRNNVQNRHCQLRFMRAGDYFHTPSTIYRKELYEKADCKALNSQFRLFEDDPTWYSMLKNVPEVRVSFIPQVQVLYRIHDQSISNTAKPTKIYQIFFNEKKKLRRIYAKDGSWLEKMYFFFVDKRWPKYLSPINYYNYFLVRYYKAYMHLFYRDEYQALLQTMQAERERQQKFLEYIESLQQ